MTRCLPVLFLALALSLSAFLAAGCVPDADEGVPLGTGGSTGPGSGGTGAGTGGAMGATGGRAAATGGRSGTGGGGIPVCQTATGGSTGTTGPSDPLNTPARCSSGRTWSTGTGPTMMPGDRCQGCHLWTIAGTIYPTGHEPTYCNGLSDGSVSVVITDSQCRKITLTPNSVGNFYYAGVVVGELSVRVVRGQSVRAMGRLAPHGECNACHTPDGIQGAPGRIVPPQ